jgi:N-acetylneuraminic acid mutarotase
MKSEHQNSLNLVGYRSASCGVAIKRLSKQFRPGLLMLLVSLCVSAVGAQSNEWAWMGGSVTATSFGSYGTLGTPASTNEPGAREQPATWTDSKGNFWLFGGYGFDSGTNLRYGLGGLTNEGYLNDLWKFSPATNEWTWMGGSSNLNGGTNTGAGVYGTLGTFAAGNLPPGRSGAVCWTDSKGALWLFGGQGSDSTGDGGTFNDLWEFNPSTNEWAWVAGAETVNQRGAYGTLGTGSAGNVPGARSLAVGWIDGKGDLWLFGGAGLDSAGTQGSLNDLWEFNPSTNQWAWVGGPNTAGQPGVPGKLRTPAAGNIPAARNGAVSWVDSNGNFWLFGGALRNDLWEFNPGSGEWTWMSGSTMTLSQGQSLPGVYGTLQVPASNDVPGGRTGAVSWTDAKGNFWMFGGQGYDSVGTQGVLNDLWEFSPVAGEWAWMSGSATGPTDESGQLGVYGTLQTPALGNSPGARYESAGWTDDKGNFWLIGGYGFDVEANFGYLSDLWEFQPNTGSAQVAATPEILPGSGTYTSWQTVTITDSTPGATIDYLINETAPASVYTKPITVSSSESIEAIAVASGYANSNVASASYMASFSVAATPVFSLTAGSYPTAQTVSISDTTPGATIYYAIGAEPTAPFALYSGPLTISSSETLQAYAVAENYLASNVAISAYNIGSNPSGEWAWMGGASTVPPGCSHGGSCAVPGWYGTLHTAAATNIPGARSASVSWTDSKGNLWLFGGDAWDAGGNAGYLNDLWEFSPATAQWTWMSGDNTIPACSNPDGCGPSGIYGTIGMPGATNTPGGREDAAGWSDNTGNLWIFGGLGIDANGDFGFLNDLWKFNLATNQWTWIAGSDSIPCNACGFPGVYGAFGVPANGNLPGARVPGATWKDLNGNFWMFGGLGEDSTGLECYLNDLWEFDPSTAEWAWKNGNNFCSNFKAGYPGVYGILGVPAAGNIPWSLYSPAAWTDRSGNLWIFGGIGEDTTSTGYYLNDMLEYYPSINEWAWTSANSVSAGGVGLGVYGTMGTWSPANIPGEREASESWTDENGNFWLLGGQGIIGSSLLLGTLNDLWEFKPSINEWGWMGGSSTSICLATNDNICVSWGQPGVYGNLGVPAPVNAPGGRAGAATWTDSSGNLWFFGGSAIDSQGTQGGLSDLWEYDLAGTPPVRPPSPAPTPTFSLAVGSYNSAQTVAISDQIAGATIYYTTSGATPNSSSAVYSAPIPIANTETIEAVAVATGNAVSAIASATYTINLPPAATPTFSLASGTYLAAQTVSIGDTTAGATIYYTTNGTAPTTGSTVYGGAITVSTTETIEAIAIASGFASSNVASATYTINLPPTFTLGASPTSLTVNAGSQGSVTLTVTPQNGFNSTVGFACSGLPSGASCSFNPTTVTPSGGAATTQLTISASAQAASLRRDSPPFLPTTVLAVALCLIGWKRRRRGLQLLLLVAALTALGLIPACGGGSGAGGGGGGGGTQPVNATVTVTATSGSLQQTTTISLTVN